MVISEDFGADRVSAESTIDSRYLGPITLEGGVGGGWFDTSVDLEGSRVALRLEIDFPEQFNESVVNKVDLAIDALNELDSMARSQITAALERPWTAPAVLFGEWKARKTTTEGNAEAFISRLHPSRITILPDGGRGSLDRVVITYSLGESPTAESITVRFREGIGPELDPAPQR